MLSHSAPDGAPSGAWGLLEGLRHASLSVWEGAWRFRVDAPRAQRAVKETRSFTTDKTSIQFD
jgi:hypothetical protein